MSTRIAIRRLIATACSTAPWRAIGFMVLSFALGVAYLVVLVAAIAVGIGTLIIWVGVPILVMTMVGWRAAASAERWRVRRMLGAEIAPGVYEAELNLMRTEEWARTGDDALWRRSKLGLHLDAPARERVNAWFSAREESLARRVNGGWLGS